MKKNILLIILGLSCIVAKSQTEKFSNIYKFCQAGKYKEAVPKLYSFAKSDSTHIPANYELSKIYNFWSDSIATVIKANNKPIDSIVKQQCFKAIIFNDSAITLLRKISRLMNTKFLFTNIRYNEFNITCPNMEQVECVRNYIEKLITKIKNKNDAFKDLLAQIVQLETKKQRKQEADSTNQEILKKYGKKVEITITYTQNSSYTVPAGKLFYLEKVYSIEGYGSVCLSANGVIRCYLEEKGKGVYYNLEMPYNPLIAGDINIDTYHEGTTFSCKSDLVHLIGYEIY